MDLQNGDPELGARQPLLGPRRLSSRLQERQQFQQSQRQAVMLIARNGRGCLAFLLKAIFWALVFNALFLYLYLYIGSIYVIIFHLGEPCDQPLAWWLVFWMILPTLHALFDRPPPREEGWEQERLEHSRRAGIAHFMWFVCGMCWLHLSKTCVKTNAPLYLWVRFVIYVYSVGCFFLLVLPCLMTFLYIGAYSLYHALIDRGYITNPKAASSETVDNLEIVPYDPSLFASEDSDKDTRPSGECCCCQEDFGPDLEIVRTTCGHYYHKECLVEWLKLAKTCPLCRCDLDAGKKDDLEDDEPVVTDPGPVGIDVEGDEELARRLQTEEFQAAGGFP